MGAEHGAAHSTTITNSYHLSTPLLLLVLLLYRLLLLLLLLHILLSPVAAAYVCRYYRPRLEGDGAGVM